VRDHQAPREECLIAEWPEGHDAPLDYWLSNLPVDTEPEQLLRLAQLRWMIGLDYKQLKGHLGLDRLAHSRAYSEPKVAGGTFGAGSLPPDVNGDVSDLSGHDRGSGRPAPRRGVPAIPLVLSQRLLQPSACCQDRGEVEWQSSCASNAPPSTIPFKAIRCPESAGDGTHPVAEIRLGYTNGRTRTLDASNTIDPRSLAVRKGRSSGSVGLD
jgi:hypothetical protein